MQKSYDLPPFYMVSSDYGMLHVSSSHFNIECAGRISLLRFVQCNLVVFCCHKGIALILL